MATHIRIGGHPYQGAFPSRQAGSVRSGLFRVECMATTVLIASISMPLLTELVSMENGVCYSAPKIARTSWGAVSPPRVPIPAVLLFASPSRRSYYGGPTHKGEWAPSGKHDILTNPYWSVKPGSILLAFPAGKQANQEQEHEKHITNNQHW